MAPPRHGDSSGVLSVECNTQMLFANNPPFFQHSKVTMGEPASIGTLLELGNCAYETLRFLADKNQPSIEADRSRALSTIKVVRQLLESVVLYASTQLVMWLTKQDGEQVGDMELDEKQQTEGHGYGHNADVGASTLKDRERERRMKRKSLTLADRLRRGMTGEMTMDLQALVTKSKPVIAKSSEVIGDPKLVDLMHIMGSFLKDHAVNPQ